MDIKKINKIIKRKSKTAFDFDLEKNLQYMNSLPNPKSLLDRSYLQYKCQAFQKGWGLIYIHNLMAFLLIVPLVIYLLSRKKINKEKYSSKNNKAVFIYSGLRNIIPDSIKREFEIEEVSFAKDYYLDFNDIKDVFNLISRFFYSPYFTLMLIYKISIYRYLIDAYSPNAIICTSEYSFTSSYLTQYCKTKNIEHFNIMHGEKLLYIRDSFFEFNRCYVWDIHYINLFKKLRAEITQFRVENPHKQSNKINNNKQCKYTLTYYLSGDEGEGELMGIKNIIESIKVLPEKISIRPHPIYSDIEVVRKIFNCYTIELASQIKIEESIKQTEFIISLYSTVLYQAHLAGKETIIDDLSDKEKYLKLQQLGFIMTDKANYKLSEFIEGINKKRSETT